MNKVLFFRTHQSVWVRGLGDLGNTFPPNNTTFDGLEMYTDEKGVVMKFALRGQRKKILVPFPNVAGAELPYEDEQEPVTVKAVKHTKAA